jgi:hypothetical protein
MNDAFKFQLFILVSSLVPRPFIVVVIISLFQSYKNTTPLTSPPSPQPTIPLQSKKPSKKGSEYLLAEAEEESQKLHPLS